MSRAPPGEVRRHIQPSRGRRLPAGPTPPWAALLRPCDGAQVDYGGGDCNDGGGDGCGYGYVFFFSFFLVLVLVIIIVTVLVVVVMAVVVVVVVVVLDWC